MSADGVPSTAVTELGFKELRLDNFLMQDPVVSFFVQVDRGSGEISPTTPEYWAKVALAIKLSERVPFEVRKQFEAARALLVYAYFFYPFFTLAMELSMRVAESAIRHRCAALGAPESLDNFHNRVEWLYSKDHLSKEKRDLWHAIRETRNETIHSDKQMILTPGMSIPILDSLTEYIDDLFPAAGASNARS